VIKAELMIEAVSRASLVAAVMKCAGVRGFRYAIFHEHSSVTDQASGAWPADRSTQCTQHGSQTSHAGSVKRSTSLHAQSINTPINGYSITNDLAISRSFISYRKTRALLSDKFALFLCNRDYARTVVSTH